MLLRIILVEEDRLGSDGSGASKGLGGGALGSEIRGGQALRDGSGMILSEVGEVDVASRLLDSRVSGGLAVGSAGLERRVDGRGGATGSRGRVRTGGRVDRVAHAGKMGQIMYRWQVKWDG